MIKEAQIEQMILEWLLSVRGGFFWKNHTTGIFDPKKKIFRKSKNKFFIRGVSDIIGIYQGRFVGIEVKKPTDYRFAIKHWDRLIHGPLNTKRDMHLSNQVNFIEKIRKRGGIAGMVCDIDTAKQVLGIL